MLGVSAEILHGDRLAGYRYVQGSYCSTARIVATGPDGKKRLKQNLLKAGAGKVKLTPNASEQLDPALISAREALIEWFDPDREFTEEFFVRVDPANGPQGELVVKVIIDGVIQTDDDYCLYVDTFFDCIGIPRNAERKVVELLGGCGVPDCCAEGFLTENLGTYWNWFNLGLLSEASDWKPYTARTSDYRLAWGDVLTAANQIVAEFPRLSDGYPLKSKLPDYLAKIELLKKLAANS